jgi:hypothetical protein
LVRSQVQKSVLSNEIEELPLALSGTELTKLRKLDVTLRSVRDVSRGVVGSCLPDTTHDVRGKTCTAQAVSMGLAPLHSQSACRIASWFTVRSRVARE